MENHRGCMCAMAMILALGLWAGGMLGMYLEQTSWRAQAVKRGHAEWKVVNEYGRVEFRWKDNVAPAYGEFRWKDRKEGKYGE